MSDRSRRRPSAASIPSSIAAAASSSSLNRSSLRVDSPIKSSAALSKAATNTNVANERFVVSCATICFGVEPLLMFGDGNRKGKVIDDDADDGDEDVNDENKPPLSSSSSNTNIRSLSSMTSTPTRTRAPLATLSMRSPLRDRTSDDNINRSLVTPHESPQRHTHTHGHTQHGVTNALPNIGEVDDEGTPPRPRTVITTQNSGSSNSNSNSSNSLRIRPGLYSMPNQLPAAMNTTLIDRNRILTHEPHTALSNAVNR
jgi:hypothetical protein